MLGPDCGYVPYVFHFPCGVELAKDPCVPVCPRCSGLGSWCLEAGGTSWWSEVTHTPGHRSKVTIAPVNWDTLDTAASLCVTTPALCASMKYH